MKKNLGSEFVNKDLRVAGGKIASALKNLSNSVISFQSQITNERFKKKLDAIKMSFPDFKEPL